MGANQARAARKGLSDEEINFDHFHILRAIGKGSFGKVCIVEKRGTGKLYAMKYMNKLQCIERDALNNVLREVEILSSLEHPFLVNLWFSFQGESADFEACKSSGKKIRFQKSVPRGRESNFAKRALDLGNLIDVKKPKTGKGKKGKTDEEDLFMVSDLFMGGDLRYHIQQKVQFKEDCVQLYIIEMALALEYLRTKSIVHRDIKPDNILLDENGHAHLTDFNIATILRDGQLATSMSGTKPYMAPEIFACVTDECVGYNFAVDWWSLGICGYEILALTRPYDIHSMTSICEVRSLFSTPLSYPRHWSSGIVDLLSRLICVEPGARISSLSELKTVPVVSKVDIAQILDKKPKPSFTPPKDHLNCDPTLELEEMIVEAKPLHKKKKRLAKQKSLQPSFDLRNELQSPDQNAKVVEFLTYNREQELRKKEREMKEMEWEEELKRSMEMCELGSGIGDGEPERRKGMRKSMSYMHRKSDSKTGGGIGGGKQISLECATDKSTFKSFDAEDAKEE